jgi:protein involved in polysaccharide export with SLBB domain
VEVSGEVLNPLSTPYIDGKTLAYYVDQGGGFSLRAKKKKAYVVYANGTASATKQFLFFKNYPKVLPGSQIVIPEKIQREPLPATAWIGIGSSISSLALTIVAILNN